MSGQLLCCCYFPLDRHEKNKTKQKLFDVRLDPVYSTDLLPPLLDSMPAPRVLSWQRRAR